MNVNGRMGPGGGVVNGVLRSMCRHFTPGAGERRRWSILGGHTPTYTTPTYLTHIHHTYIHQTPIQTHTYTNEHTPATGPCSHRRHRPQPQFLATVSSQALATVSSQTLATVSSHSLRPQALATVSSHRP